jgi:hypothetical protein
MLNDGSPRPARCLRLLVNRDVVIVRDGQPEHARVNGGQARRRARQSGSGRSLPEPPGRSAGDMTGSRGSPACLWPSQGYLAGSGLLADAAVDSLAEQIGVAEVAGVLLDHVEDHLAQRDGRAVLHWAADGEVG